MPETRARFLSNLIGATSTDNDFTLPDAQGTSGYVLSSGGDGTVTWEETAQAPSITSVSPTTFNGESGFSFTITGTNFDSTCVVKFVTSGGTEYTAGSLTRTSSTSLTATTPQNFTVADEPLDVKVINGSTLADTLADAIDCGGLPSWSGLTTSHTIYDSQRVGKTIQFTATDPESQTITYEKTSGSLPTNMTLSSSGLLSGTTGVVSSDSDFTFKITATDASGNATQSGDITVTVKPPVSTTYSYSGNVQTVATSTFPSEITSVTAYMWGAGGGGGNRGGWATGYDGGAGMYATGTIDISSISTLAIVVGGRGNGQDNSTSTALDGGYGGGGNLTSTSDNYYGGTGGGLSGVFNGSYTHGNSLIIAGGGGGGGVSESNGASNTGGAGGQNGEFSGSRSSTEAAKAGTSSAGGAGGDTSNQDGTAGSALQGGVPTSNQFGGTGGGGYYGGGGGGYNWPNMGGGAGGSGYLHPSLVSSGTLTAGSGTTAGNSSHSDRGTAGNAGSGSGGSAGSATNGGHGKVVISY